MWRRQWHPTPVLLPRKSHGRGAWYGDVIVGFGVYSASEVQRGVCAALDSWGEGTEDGFAACDAGIVVVSALDFHFRRMGDGILHAVAEGKRGGCAMGGAETEEEKDSILL